MSNTHKTKPYTVQMYQGHAPVEEVHDHSDGPCDLPEYSPKGINTRGQTRCYWDWLLDGKNHFCGCRLCTGHNERVQNNKRNRQHAKKKARDYAKAPELYDEEVIQQKRDFW